MPFLRFLPVALAAAVLLTPASAQQKDKPVDPDHAAKMAKGTDLFKASVRGILQTRCAKCHTGERVEGEFDLNSRETLLKGGPAGPAVVPGDHKKSFLYQLVAHQKPPHMPHERPKMPDAEIAKIAEWIDLGAPYDKPFIELASDAWTKKVIAAEAKKHWAFQPLKRVEPPVSRESKTSAIDAFIGAKLQAANLALNPPADKRTLLRRVYLDLTGLPPTPEQVEAFLMDDSPAAFEKAVDTLLASPRHGERWARHWLDLVRFAESHGFEHDYDRPTAYHYRDFVIKALNADLPFDTFAKWQIAGDELAPTDPLALMATGYLAAGVHSTQITKSEAERHRYEELDDIVGNIGTTFLGLTVGCARCHDHKFDPIPARDYYRMVSAFTTTVRTEMDVNLEPAKYAAAKAAFDAEHKPFASARDTFEKEQLPARFATWDKTQPATGPAWFWPAARSAFAVPADKRTPKQAAALLTWFATRDAEWVKLSKAEADHAAKAPKPNVVKALISSEGLPAVRLHTQGDDFLNDTHFLRRGDPAQKEGVAAVSFLQVLMPTAEAQSKWLTPPPAGSRTSFKRTAFANWLTDPKDGAGHLAARVIVNRLWQHHTGRGLVSTPSDFGQRTEPPSHPELLDYLASELIRNGWRLKPIHKLIVMSATYRQSSQVRNAECGIRNADPKPFAAVFGFPALIPQSEFRIPNSNDPEGKLFARHPVQRLEAEAIRDSILFVSGILDETMFGPGTLDDASKRRSVYFTMKRSRLIPSLVVFDAPDGTTGVGERPNTTIAPQALHLMNNPQVRAASKAFAKRVSGDGKGTDADAVKRAYLLALTREPTAAELADALAFLKGTTGAARESALADFCQVLFCLNEFLYAG